MLPIGRCFQHQSFTFRTTGPAMDTAAGARPEKFARMDTTPPLALPRRRQGVAIQPPTKCGEIVRELRSHGVSMSRGTRDDKRQLTRDRFRAGVLRAGGGLPPSCYTWRLEGGPRRNVCSMHAGSPASILQPCFRRCRPLQTRPLTTDKVSNSDVTCHARRKNCTDSTGVSTH